MTETQFLGLIERSSQQSADCEAQSHTLKQLLFQLPIHKIRVFLSSKCFVKNCWKPFIHENRRLGSRQTD